MGGKIVKFQMYVGLSIGLSLMGVKMVISFSRGIWEGEMYNALNYKKKRGGGGAKFLIIFNKLKNVCYRFLLNDLLLFLCCSNSYYSKRIQI